MHVANSWWRLDIIFVSVRGASKNPCELCFCPALEAMRIGVVRLTSMISPRAGRLPSA